MVVNEFFMQLDFFPFERQQFEDYLNELYQDGYHLVNEIGTIKLVKTRDRYFYKVVLFYKEATTQQHQFIQSYKDIGYNYIGQIGYFGIFESKQAYPLYTNEIIEDEMILSVVKKEQKWTDVLLILVFMIYILAGFFLSSTTFITNKVIFSWIFVVIGVISLFAMNLYFYMRYIQKNIDYSYQICLLRGYFITFILILMFSRERFLFWTQSFLLGLGIPFLFAVFGVFVYLFYRRCSTMIIYRRLIIALAVIAFIGGIFEYNQKDINLANVPMTLKNYTEINREQTVFLDYVVLEKQKDIFEYVDIKYEKTGKYVLDKLIDKDHIVSVKNIKGYQVYESDEYTYIMKDKNIIKTNVIDNVHEFVSRLDW